MPSMSIEDIKNVIPGETMTKPRGQLPFDKPAKTSNPEAGIQLVFDAITEPRSAKRLVKALELGAPIDRIVDSLTMMLHGEGVVSPQALPVMAPALIAMIEGMAKVANITPVYSEKEDPWSTPDEDEVEKLVAKMTGTIEDSVTPEETPEVIPVEEPEMTGLMSPPVEDNEGMI